MKLAIVFLFVLGAWGQVTNRDLVKADPRNWLTYSGSYNSQRHSGLKQVNTGNVSGLVPKWIYHIRGAEELESVPVVVDGVKANRPYIMTHDFGALLEARRLGLVEAFEQAAH